MRKVTRIVPICFPRIIAAASLVALAAGAPLQAQFEQQHIRRGVVADWTSHHLVHGAPKDFTNTLNIQNDPRWVQEWYLRHSELWWPGARTRNNTKSEAAERDWNVSLGSITFDPLFDLSYSLSDNLTGNGTLNTQDELNGSYLATAGSVITGGDSYALYPGGPGATTANFLFVDATFDNLLYPSANPLIDGYGLLFGSFLSGGGQFTSTGSSAYTLNEYALDFNIGTGTGSGFYLNPAPGGGITYPAKYVFDVTATPSCTNDYVVIGIPAVPASGGQANIVGYNNIYTNLAGTGLCSGTAPTVKFAYASGSGEVPSNISISQDGTKLAFIENRVTTSGYSAYFHVLTIGTGSGNGTGPTNSVTPANDLSVQLTPGGGAVLGSTTAPFIHYTAGDTADVAYATAYTRSSTGSPTGYVFKISNVFSGTPTITWSAAVTGATLSSPVYDTVSNKVFFTDSSGRIDYITDSGTSPSAFTGGVEGLGATSVNPPVVDSTNQMVYATFNTNGSNAIVVQELTTGKSPLVVSIGTGNTTYPGPYSPDFNNAFYTGTGTPEMYVAGTGSGTIPTLYQVGFTGTRINTTTSGSTALASGTADSSPVTEFYNAGTSKDYLFTGVTNHCVATTGGGTAGCVMSLDITSGLPTVGKNTTALAASGGTTGIIVDNDSTSSQASSIYYGTKIGGTLVKATQSGLN